jgi:hypothetical protein
MNIADVVSHDPLHGVQSEARSPSEFSGQTELLFELSGRVRNLVTSMIANSQGKREIPLDSVDRHTTPSTKVKKR